MQCHTVSSLSNGRLAWAVLYMILCAHFTKHLLHSCTRDSMSWYRDLTPLHAAVVITIGPSCQSVDELTELLRSGAACCRIDLTVSCPVSLLAFAPLHINLQPCCGHTGCRAALQDSSANVVKLVLCTHHTSMASRG